MTPHPTMPETSPQDPGQDMLSPSSVAFGLAAVVTIVFNTVLALVKDAYGPLNAAMAALTGHHWITHSLVDIAVFLLLGFIFRSAGARFGGQRLALLLIAACLVGGGGLALWFLFV